VILKAYDLTCLTDALQQVKRNCRERPRLPRRGFGDHFGIRGDVRYFQNANGNVVDGLDLDSLLFWRVDGGVGFP
jgi:hypothetical protein